MNVKNLSLIIASILIVAGGVWWYRVSEKVPETIQVQKPRVSVTIGTPYTPGFMIPLFSQEKGYLSNEGIDATFIDDQSTYSQMPAEFAAGRYDVVAISNSVFAASSDVHDHGKMELLAYYSLEGSAIVARKGVNSLDEAKGKTIAVLPGGDFLAYWALRSHGIPLKDVKVVTGTWTELSKDILANKYDYAYLTAPDIERYVNESGARVVYYAKDDLGSVTTGYTFSDRFMDAHHDAAVGFIRAYFKALQYAQVHPQEFRDFLMRTAKMSQDEADVYLLNGSHLIDARENISALSPGFGIKNFGGNIRYIQEYLTQIGRGPQRDLEDRIDSHLVSEATREY